MIEDQGQTEDGTETQGAADTAEQTTKVGNLESPDLNTPLKPTATVEDAKLPPQVVATDVQTEPNAIGTEKSEFTPPTQAANGLRLVAVPAHLTGGNLQLAAALVAPREGDLPPLYTPSGHVAVIRPAVTVATPRQATALETEINTDAFNLFHKIRAYYGDFGHKFEGILSALHKTSIAPDEDDADPVPDPTLVPSPEVKPDDSEPKAQIEA